MDREFEEQYDMVEAMKELDKVKGDDRVVMYYDTTWFVTIRNYDMWDDQLGPKDEITYNSHSLPMAIYQAIRALEKLNETR